MAKVLLGWEKGDGFYHLHRLETLRYALKKEGHTCILAVHDLKRAREYIKDRGVKIIQCPSLPPSSTSYYRSGKKIESIADIYLGSGYCDVDAIHACILAWQDIIDELGIELAISDYSPSLNIATIKKVPCITVGDGFTMARIQNGITSEFNGKFSEASRLSSLGCIKMLDRLMQDVDSETGLLQRMIYGDKGFCITYRQLDHNYSPHLRETVGPLLGAIKNRINTREYDYFAYLSLDYSGTMALLEGLKGSGYQGSAYLRDCPEDVRKNLESEGLHIFREPQDLNTILEKTKVVIHHGGLGTTEQCLASGVPQLFAPRHKEQILNVQAVLDLGCSVSMQDNAKFNSEHAKKALDALMTNKGFSENAQRVAEKLVAIPGSARRLIETCHELLASPKI